MALSRPPEEIPPMSSTSTTSAQPRRPGAASYRMVRDGVAAVLVAASAPCCWASPCTTPGTPSSWAPSTAWCPDSWGAALGAKTVWPVLVWSLLVRRRRPRRRRPLGRCPDARPDRLTRDPRRRPLRPRPSPWPRWRSTCGDARLRGRSRGNPVFFWALALIAGPRAPAASCCSCPRAGGPVPLRLTLMSIGGVVGLVTLILGLRPAPDDLPRAPRQGPRASGARTGTRSSGPRSPSSARWC